MEMMNEVFAMTVIQKVTETCLVVELDIIPTRYELPQSKRRTKSATYQSMESPTALLIAR